MVGLGRLGPASCYRVIPHHLGEDGLAIHFWKARGMVCGKWKFGGYRGSLQSTTEILGSGGVGNWSGAGKALCGEAGYRLCEAGLLGACTLG